MVKVLGFILLCLSVISCNQDNKNTEKTGASANGIRRYEVDLFNIDTTHFEDGIARIYPRYKAFLGDKLPDSYGMQQLREFVTDPSIRSTYDYAMKQFPDLQWLDDAFKVAFNNLQKELPGTKIPVVYTYISGFDVQMPVKYGDSALIIGLDLYLGPEYTAYKKMGYPMYIIKRLSREYILADCFKEMAWVNIPESKGGTLLDAMIEQGKTLYFAQLMLPEEKEEHLIKYTPEQMQWVTANEKNLWSFIIENQLLYSSDQKALTTFMTDGPFTSGFSEESPARTGSWLGWQIVKDYMDNNSVTLKDLLKDTDSQKILEKSGFKPSRI